MGLNDVYECAKQQRKASGITLSGTCANFRHRKKPETGRIRPQPTGGRSNYSLQDCLVSMHIYDECTSTITGSTISGCTSCAAAYRATCDQ